MATPINVFVHLRSARLRRVGRSEQPSRASRGITDSIRCHFAVCERYQESSDLYRVDGESSSCRHCSYASHHRIPSQTAVHQAAHHGGRGSSPLHMRCTLSSSERMQASDVRHGEVCVPGRSAAVRTWAFPRYGGSDSAIILVWTASEASLQAMHLPIAIKLCERCVGEGALL